jgi:hypothetical protein
MKMENICADNFVRIRRIYNALRQRKYDYQRLENVVAGTAGAGNQIYSEIDEKKYPA